MESETKAKIFMGIFGFACLFTLGYAIYDSQRMKLEWEKELTAFKTYLSFDYVLKEGIVESPSVIILLDSKSAFLMKASEIEAPTIYYERIAVKVNFYVFGEEDNMLVAYRYQTKAWD